MDDDGGYGDEVEDGEMLLPLENMQKLLESKSSPVDWVKGRFVQQFSVESVVFVKIQKQLKCRIQNSSLSTASDDELADMDMDGSAFEDGMLKVRDKAVLTGVFTKYRLQAADASNEDN
ncbi:unnamed protein product [Linum tenue]|uniref:Uncharacterized protein n=1 Tax=Linum tenue TaxID=586396 RepID=A0AAV0S3Y6_9ROSI|nr:unnamed protein product [Linum tenue]